MAQGTRYRNAPVLCTQLAGLSLAAEAAAMLAAEAAAKLAAAN